MPEQVVELRDHIRAYNIKTAEKVMPGDKVVVSIDGSEVVFKVKKILNEQKEIDKEVSFVRKATQKDLEKDQEIPTSELISRCKKLVEKNNLEIKILDAVYTLGKDKMYIAFLSEKRIDFRQLVKDLAQEFRARIELRQVYPKEYIAYLQHLGVCGRKCCCASFLPEGKNVLFKMAKMQNLSLNPAKLNGACGKYMCCIAFENDFYEEINKNLPQKGAVVKTPAGVGTVSVVHILKQSVLVKIKDENDDINVHLFPIEEIEVIKEKQKKN